VKPHIPPYTYFVYPVSPIRGYVESFENSSFTRPSGGVFEVKFAKTHKMKRRYLEVLLFCATLPLKFGRGCNKKLHKTDNSDYFG